MTDNSLTAIIDTLNWEASNTRYQLKPVRWSHAAIGGPEAATVEVYGNERDLLNIWTWLGARLDIVDARYGPLWWGTIEQIDVDVARLRLAASLGPVVNWVKARYVDTAGAAMETTIHKDVPSQWDYGVRQILLMLGGLRASTDAENLCDTILTQYRRPVTQIYPGGGRLVATLSCRGYWDRLGYRYYNNTSLTSADTMVIAKAILQTAAAGDAQPAILPELVPPGGSAPIVILPDAGVATGTTGYYFNQYRTARDKINELLRTGTNHQRRILPAVTAGKAIVFAEEPAYDPTTWYGVRGDGTVYQPGAGLASPPQTLRAGMWLGASEYSFGGGQFVTFVERGEFDANAWRWTWTPRVQENARDHLGFTVA